MKLSLPIFCVLKLARPRLRHPALFCHNFLTEGLFVLSLQSLMFFSSEGLKFSFFMKYVYIILLTPRKPNPRIKIERPQT